MNMIILDGQKNLLNLDCCVLVSENIIIVNGVMVLALAAEFYNSFNFYILYIFFNVIVAWLAFFYSKIMFSN